jgi:hypothetical protein
MNSNTIAMKTNTLLGRIQKVSASLKMLFLIATLVTGLISLGAIIAMCESYDGEKLEDALSLLIWAAIYWYAYKLFRACGRGDLFSAGVVGSLRRIGWLGISLGVAEGIISFARAFHDIPLWSDLIFLPAFAFSTVPGIACLCIAWIMDEGRKVQQENELTV